MVNKLSALMLAGVMAFLPAFTQAQVVCTDVNPDITSSGNATLDIDLNNDNTPDFRITSAQSGILSFVVVQGSQIGTSNFVLCSGSNSAACLPLNTPISSTSSTWAQMNSTNQQMVLVVGTTVSGPWAGATDQYLGLALAVGSSTYYGWARFSFSSNSNQYTFKDYAYQSSAGQQILAGEMCGSITSPTFNLPDSVCAGTSVTVTAGTGTDTPTSYSWAASPGVTNSSSSASVTVLTFTAAGTSTVLLLVTNSSTFGLAVRTLQVKPTPTITISPAATTICPGASMTLTALSNATSFSWTANPPGNISTPTSHSIVITPSTTSNYIVQATLSGCTATASRLLVQAFLPPIVIASSPSVICADPQNNSNTTATVTTGNYVVTGAPGWPLSVTPNAGGALVSTGSPYLAGNTLVPINFTLSYAGCPTVVVRSFSISANPVLTVTPFPSLLCEGNSFTMSATGANAYSVLSTPSSSMNVVPGPGYWLAFTPTANTSFSVYGSSVAGHCKSATKISSVTVVPLPVVTVTGATVCTGATATLTAGGGMDFSWEGPSGAVSSSSVAIINAGNSEGTIVYTITATGENSCTAKAQATLSVLVCTGIGEENIPGVKVFPQPAHDELRIVGIHAEGAELAVTDLQGRIISRGTFKLEGDAAHLSISQLLPGIYVLTVKKGDLFLNTRFVKE